MRFARVKEMPKKQANDPNVFNGEREKEMKIQV